jgi:hypothetical protein
MKILVATVLVAMTAVPTLAQSTRTTSPEGTMTETQKGGPASRESKPNSGGQETVTKGAGPTNAPPPGPAAASTGGKPAPK